jgi:hypothetical protein
MVCKWKCCIVRCMPVRSFYHSLISSCFRNIMLRWPLFLYSIIISLCAIITVSLNKEKRFRFFKRKVNGCSDTHAHTLSRWYQYHQLGSNTHAHTLSHWYQYHHSLHMKEMLFFSLWKENKKGEAACMCINNMPRIWDPRVLARLTINIISCSHNKNHHTWP